MEQVVEVRCKSDHIMSVKLVIGSEVFNVVSVYEPQIWLDEDIKRLFKEDLNEIIESIPQTEKLLIRGDFNGQEGMVMRQYMEALVTARETVEGCLF